jgi:hypothetical protein
MRNIANVAGKAKRTRTDSVVEPAPEPVEPQIPDLKTTAEHLVYGCPSAQISPTSPANIQLTALQPSRSRHRDKSQVNGPTLWEALLPEPPRLAGRRSKNRPSA